MNQFSRIDTDILKKYDRPGPRYTSYPTAPLFSSAFGPEEYRREILTTNEQDEAADLSLYFHFPFCDTLCYFCGCTMQVTHSREQIAEYNRYLKQEIDLVAPMVRPRRRVTQLHWGGGTPSYLTPDEIRDVGSHIHSRFTFADDSEMGVEIDPRELTRDHMQAFREVGFNRMSIGVQDMDPAVQKAVNRVQPELITRDAIRWGRELGFRSVNIDLIYGLPFQTESSFAKTVQHVIELDPDRIAVFNYAHVPWLKKHQKMIRAEDLPTPDQKLQILKRTIEQLMDAGYWNIGMDHFSKTTDEMTIAQKTKTLYRNFQGYSTRAGCDLYGFGMSAIGQFRETYQQNVKTLGEYYDALRQSRLPTHVGYRMTRDDHVRKDVIMRIMCDMELDGSAIEAKHGIVFEEYFRNSLTKLEPLILDGLVERVQNRIRVVGMGRLIVRNIAMCFDAYVDQMMKEKPIFSRTV